MSSLGFLFALTLIISGSPSLKTELFNNETFLEPSHPKASPVAGAVVSSSEEASGDGLSYHWNSWMLTWQRSAFHFQPQNGWMNDPNAPLYHKGWYHLFYQYNPSSAVWVENITWGHAVSKDMIHWLHLPQAMVPDQPYDLRGVWTGSATTLPDGRIMVVYTGNTDVQVQNLAYPTNLSDPLLLKWAKYPGNPVIVPPPGVGPLEFRDPTTAWPDPKTGHWFLTVGSQLDKAGVAFVYETADFKRYKLLDGFLHSVPGTGMWECVDFYPISTIGSGESITGSGIKHVLKASLFDETHDYYAIGTYDPFRAKWTPDFAQMDIGKGLRVDYGKCYASKTFYDQKKHRRVLFVWVAESDPQDVDIAKGWASVQGIPRTLTFDKKTGTHLLQWPIEEIKSLRFGDPIVTKVKLQPGSLLPINVSMALQLDISVSFQVDKSTLSTEAAKKEADFKYNCSNSGGSVNRGILGPFGLAVMADEALTELTSVYFYIHKGVNGNVDTHFCTDLTRSSQASGVVKEVYGSRVPTFDDEKLSARILVDHSIVESFGQGGRTVITSRVYPPRAIIHKPRKVFLFNNATGTSVEAFVKIWQMKSAHIKPFPF